MTNFGRICLRVEMFFFFFYSILRWSVAVSTMRRQSSRIAAFLQEDKPPIFSWETEVAVTTVLHYHATREKQQQPALIALPQTVLVQIVRKAQTSILRSADYTGCANKKQSPRKKFYTFGIVADFFSPDLCCLQRRI